MYGDDDGARGPILIAERRARSNDSVESHKRMDTVPLFVRCAFDVGNIYVHACTRVNRINIYIDINISETRVDMEQAGAEGSLAKSRSSRRFKEGGDHSVGN